MVKIMRILSIFLVVLAVIYGILVWVGNKPPCSCLGIEIDFRCAGIRTMCTGLMDPCDVDPKFCL